MPRLDLSLLGPFAVTLDGEPVVLRLSKAQALLAYLAVESGRAHTRGALAGLLWPDYVQSSALTSLRSALSAATARRASCAICPTT
jgi:DNA-binding SARP family transcriptional activator